MTNLSDVDSNMPLKILRDPVTIRQRSEILYQRTLSGDSPHFEIDLSKLKPCCDYVLDIAKKTFPNMDVPFHSRWRHLELGCQTSLDKLNSPQQQFEITILSVLLDAGAGNQWRYVDPDLKQTFSRSEGLALATLNMYTQGYFSAQGKPFHADIKGLQNISADSISIGFQVKESNPLVGLEGRSQLIRSLASTMKNYPERFNSQHSLGSFYDYVIKQCTVEHNRICAEKVFEVVLDSFSDIWPSRYSLNGNNLGDVWQHSAIQTHDETDSFIPFHKLSQWLTYSLLEPITRQGYKLSNLDKLTGLAEYRNGGLFIDLDVINLKQQMLKIVPHKPDSELIIEWRAITICLLDILWQNALTQLQLSKSQFPMVSFLEAGTWKAGRLIAKHKRQDSSPPLSIQSDGTVF